MDANIAINWLSNNDTVPNPKKFWLMFLATDKSIGKEMALAGKTVKLSSTVELPGIIRQKFEF